ncbi:cupredoxin domain-containing protein [Bacillus taeanensis]|nr:cupredoxin domain-containing protein [Bacillus taeanensis]
MTPALLVTLVVISFLSFWVIGIVMVNRKKITCMTGMMVAMALGMMVGLIIGTLLGILLSGQLMASTLISMIIGLTVGFFAGVAVSLMAVLDGMLSGLMGGMMGAMLGEMLAMDHPNAFLKIMFVLFICLTFTLIYMINSELEKKNRWLGNPIIIVTILIIFFYSYEQLGNIVEVHNGQTGFTAEAKTHDHDSMKQSNINTETIKVTAEDFRYTPASIKVPKGKEVKILLLNNGKVDHDFEIEILRKSGKAVHLHALPGKESSKTFVFEEAGTYHFVCTIPGHKEAGMHGTLIVL